MHDAGSDEVSQVVGLEVEPVAEGSVFSSSHLCSDGLVLLRLLLGALLPVHLGYDDWSVEVSVGALRLLDEFHEAVDYLAYFRVFVHSIYRRQCLKPFIHVAVVEWWSVALSLFLSGCYEEVVPAMSRVRLPCLPHALH